MTFEAGLPAAVVLKPVELWITGFVAAAMNFEARLMAAMALKPVECGGRRLVMEIGDWGCFGTRKSKI